MIDCVDKKGFTEARLKEFISSLKQDDELHLLLDSIEFDVCKKEELIERCFKHHFSHEILDDDIFDVVSAEEDLRFDGKNFKWWIKTDKRLEKLNDLLSNAQKREMKENKTVIADIKKTFSIGIATLIGNELSDIHHLKGTKEECIDFLNEDMFRRYVDESLKAKVVINLAFDEDEFNAAFSENSTKEEKEAYKKSIELWYSLDELAEMGAIELR